MKRLILAAFVAATGLFFGGNAHAFSINGCSNSERPDILAAASFIDSNLSTLVGMMDHLDPKDRREFLRKWGRVNIKCREKSRCRAGAFGYAHGGPGNGVKICFANMVDNSFQSRCDLVDVIVHEAGHANGYTIFSNHDSPTQNTRDNDAVYRMGTIARQFCEARAAAGAFNDANLSGFRRGRLGESCVANSGCNSQKCERGACVCRTDSHCNNPNMTCIKPVSQRNYCAPTGLASGSYCTRNRQCASGKCKSGGLGQPFCK